MCRSKTGTVCRYRIQLMYYEKHGGRERKSLCSHHVSTTTRMTLWLGQQVSVWNYKLWLYSTKREDLGKKYVHTMISAHAGTTTRHRWRLITICICICIVGGALRCGAASGKYVLDENQNENKNFCSTIINFAVTGKTFYDDWLPPLPLLIPLPLLKFSSTKAGG